MKKLYPPIEPYNSGMLPVSDIHTLYFEESGNPKGKPVIVLHGGPGSGTDEYYRQMFNPEKYRIIIFDQRGAGKSTPPGEISENTTQNLVSDIEKLREHLGLKKWAVYGRSWGSTLALYYAISHPEAVEELMIGAVFTYSSSELEWFERSAISFFPDYWEKCFGHLTNEQRRNIYETYNEKIVSDNTEDHEDVIKNFGSWQYRLLTLEERPMNFTEDYMKRAYPSYKIFLHYTHNNGFMQDGEIMDNIHKIKHLPVYIIHARYDMATPLITAWKIHKKLPKSELEIVPVAGHSTSEPANIDAIIRMTDRLAA